MLPYALGEGRAKRGHILVLDLVECASFVDQGMEEFGPMQPFHRLLPGNDEFCPWVNGNSLADG